MSGCPSLTPAATPKAMTLLTIPSLSQERSELGEPCPAARAREQQTTMLSANGTRIGAFRCTSRRFRTCVTRAAAIDMVVTQEMLQVAQQTADAAAAVTCPLFRQKIKVDTKDDSSPVTEADREAELAMKKIVLDALPQHAVFGEEFGFSPGSGVPHSVDRSLVCSTRAASFSCCHLRRFNNSAVPWPGLCNCPGAASSLHGLPACGRIWYLGIVPGLACT